MYIVGIDIAKRKHEAAVIDGEGSAYLLFFNDTATTEIYTLSLHDALPISAAGHAHQGQAAA